MSLFGRLTYADQGLILNNYFISGLQSVTPVIDFNQVPVYVAGIGALRMGTNQQPIPNFTLEQIITLEDVVFQNILPNNSLINGLFIHGQNLFSFSSGLINSYGLSCRVGDFLKSNTSFDIYGGLQYITNTGQFSGYLNPSGYAMIDLPDFSSISVGLNEAYFDRVVGFSMSVAIKNVPVYTMGSLSPVYTKTIFPVEVKISFDVEIDNSTLYPVTQNVCLNYQQNIYVNIVTRCTNKQVNYISLSGAQLTRETYKGQIGQNAAISYEYTAYYNKLPLFAASSEYDYMIPMISGNFIVSGGSPFGGNLGAFVITTPPTVNPVKTAAPTVIGTYNVTSNNSPGPNIPLTGWLTGQGFNSFPNYSAFSGNLSFLSAYNSALIALFNAI